MASFNGSKDGLFDTLFVYNPSSKVYEDIFTISQFALHTHPISDTVNLQTQLDTKYTATSIVGNDHIYTNFNSGVLTISSTISQLQFDAKQEGITTGALTDILATNLTVDRALVSNGIGKISASLITSAELAYLDNCSSNIQIQLNAKEVILTGAIEDVKSVNMITSKVVVSNGFGKLDSALCSIVEVDYLNGATSNIQTQLDGKQGTLINYAETAGTTTTIDEYFDDATPTSTHLAWLAGVYVNNLNVSQTITIPLYHHYFDLGSGTCFMSIQIKADTATDALISVNDSTGWNEVSEIRFDDLSTTEWKTYTWSFTIPSNGKMNFHIGYVPTGSSLTQTAGNLEIKNLRLYKTTATATISSQLSCVEDVICGRTISAKGFASTSDRRIKTNIKNASIDTCVDLFNKIDVKTYNRTDFKGNRLGFIANDFYDNIPEEFENLVGMLYGGEQALLSLSYDRIVCVLWGVVKNQQKQIDELNKRGRPSVAKPKKKV